LWIGCLEYFCPEKQIHWMMDCYFSAPTELDFEKKMLLYLVKYFQAFQILVD